MEKSKPEKEKGINIYDRILRENTEQIFMPLIKQHLKYEIKIAEPITEKLTKTIERETDFLYKVTTTNNQTLLLHIEFQTSNDAKMLQRMAEYHGLIFKKFELPIHHIVVYLGKAEVKMINQLKPNEIFTGFDLIAINELETKQFLSSQVPEIILLAFLTKYNENETEAIIRAIIEQIRIKATSNKELNKYVNQLMLLTRLRKLDSLTVKILEEMPLTIDIEKDILYKRGIAKGKAEGIAKGKVEGKSEGVIALFKEGFTIDKIASIFQLSIETVSEILEKN